MSEFNCEINDVIDEGRNQLMKGSESSQLEDNNKSKCISIRHSSYCTGVPLRHY